MDQPLSDCRGPILYPGMDVVRDSDGVQAKGLVFSLDEGCPVSRRARWIAPDKTEFPEVHHLALLKKVVELDSAPEQVIAQISADPAFRLYVNGQLCARGPDDIGSDIPVIEKDRYQLSTKNWLCVQRDLTPFFREGTNVIAVEVFNYQRLGAYLTSGILGFWFHAEISTKSGARSELSTDTNWSATTADYFDFTAEDARVVYRTGREPLKWRTAEEVHADWRPAEILPDRKMSLSQIPPCIETVYPWGEVTETSHGVQVQEGNTPRIAFHQDGFLVLKVDRVIPAYLGLVVNGSQDAELTFSMEETRGSPNFKVKCVLRAGRQELEFPGYGSCTYLRVEASRVTKPVEISDLRLVFTSQPVRYLGHFECNDPVLNQMWQASRHELQICMQTHHLDSPHHQEPISDPGDYMIEALMNYYAFGSPWLARQDIRKFAQVLETVNYRNFHTSYSLLWLQMLLDYYDYTADDQTVLDVAPVAHKLLATFAGWRGKNGLVCNAPSYMFMDWVEIAGFKAHHPPPVIGMGYLSAFYYQALANGIRIADLQDNADLAESYRQQRTSLNSAFNAVLWDEGAGLYRDGIPFVSDVPPSDPWLPADTDIETHTPHVNTLAVLYGLAPAKRRAEIMERVMQIDEPDVQPYFMHFVFDALNRAGIFQEHAVRLMQRWEIVPETGTFYEMWGAGDLSHAWNGTPLVQMSSRILGVTPTEPGFSEFAIAPQPCGLKYARGRVPTPHGAIEVEWKLDGGEAKITRLTHPDPCRLAGADQKTLRSRPEAETDATAVR